MNFRDAVVYAIGYNNSMPLSEPLQSVAQLYLQTRLFPFRLQRLLVLTAIFTVVSWHANAQDCHKAPSAQEILREASRIALQQPEAQTFWPDRTLEIAAVQMRASDFKGAHHSIRKSGYDYGRREELNNLAKALAAVGKYEEALDVTRELLKDSPSESDEVVDAVRLCWMSYLLSNHNLSHAGEVAGEITSIWHRPTALRLIAIAHSKAGDKVTSHRYFKRALDAAAAIQDESRRETCLWEIARAQAQVGQTTAAADTIQKLIKLAQSSKDAWAKMYGLRYAAVHVAQGEDRATAQRLFGLAIESRIDMEPAHRLSALNLVATCQASVGYFTDALRTARLDTQLQTDTHSFAPQDQALCAVAIAQAKGGDLEAALTTAFTIQKYPQYRNDALLAMADLQLAKGNNRGALATIQHVLNPTQKATAMLKVAIEYAKAGNNREARAVAAQVTLRTPEWHRFGIPVFFDYKSPQTWGVLYEPSYANASYRWSIARASELAAAAMTLAQLLHEEQDTHFDVVLNNNNEEVVRAIARAHAANGKPRDAYSWVRVIGSDKKIVGERDIAAQSAVELRISALIGLAEGMLDRKAQGTLKEGSSRKGCHGVVRRRLFVRRGP